MNPPFLRGGRYLWLRRLFVRFGLQEKLAHVAKVSSGGGIHFAIQIVVVRVAMLGPPFEVALAAGCRTLCDFVFRCNLLAILRVYSMVDHPAASSVWLAHSTGNHVFVLVAIDDDQPHAVSLGIGFSDRRNIVVSEKRLR